MIKDKKKVCVFASATNELDEVYYQAAKELGELIAKNGYSIVYGGSHRGLMYACAGAVQAAGSDLYGVMPQKMVDIGFDNPQDCKEFYITKGMRERKAKIDELSDAVVALAGGFGTFEELSEIIVQKQLGYNEKPIVILNTMGFYDNLIRFFEDFIQKGFAHSEARKVYYVANTPKEAIEYIKTYKPEETYVKYHLR